MHLGGVLEINWKASALQEVKMNTSKLKLFKFLGFS